MNDYSHDFGPFEKGIWLNNASEGALPKVSVAALKEAISWKVQPYDLTHQKFQEVPQRLKKALARLLHVEAEDVILGNSATFGIHLLANGLPLQAGDEVVLMQNDFPTDILPWLLLEEKGIKIIQQSGAGPVLSLAEIEQVLTPQTRVVCLPHVHTFSGYRLPIREIGSLCRKRGIIFIVNMSQSLGYIPVDLRSLPVDAVVSAGFKWLCGPYGTGLCWVRPDVRQKLKNSQAFWVNVLSEEELTSTEKLQFKPQNSARSFDVFGTANFFNFVPWTASIEYLLALGIPVVEKTIRARVDEFIAGLDPAQYDLISPRNQEERSALIVFSHRLPEKNSMIFRDLLKQKIYPTKWKGNLRVSPHIFNTPAEIQTILRALSQLG